MSSDKQILQLIIPKSDSEKTMCDNILYNSMTH